MPKPSTMIVLAILASILALGLLEYRLDFSSMEAVARAHPIIGMVLYIGFLIISIVALPLTSLPLLPIAARLWGVWITATLSILGWWIGCLIAFQIARAGRRVLEYFTSLEAVDRLEARIPRDIGFVGIVILRMILPVDITSFTLGLLKHLTFKTYAIASLLGIIPFAFVWSAAGGQLAQGKFLITALLLSLMLIGVMLIRRAWQR